MMQTNNIVTPLYFDQFVVIVDTQISFMCLLNHLFSARFVISSSIHLWLIIYIYIVCINSTAGCPKIFWSIKLISFRPRGGDS